MMPSHPSIFNEDGTIKEPNFLWENEGYQEAYMSAWMDAVVLICQKQLELSTFTSACVQSDDEAVYRSMGGNMQHEADRIRIVELNQEISTLLARVTALKRQWDRVAQTS